MISGKSLRTVLTGVIVLFLVSVACTKEVEVTREVEVPGTPAVIRETVVVTPTPTATAITGPKRGGHLRVATSSFSHFDVHASFSTAVLLEAAPALNALFQKKWPNFIELEGDLVKEWDFSGDFRTLTLKLQRGVVNHDGLPWTSSDAKFTLERAASPETVVSSVFGKTWTGIETPDDNTLILRMAAPQPTLLDKLAMINGGMYTEASVKARDPKEWVTGTGPFRLTVATPRELVEFERFDEYFKEGLPYLDKLSIFPIGDSATKHAAFRAGRLDFLSTVGGRQRPEPWIEHDKALPGQVTWITAAHFGNIGIGFNTDASGPWQDVRVRQAIALVIDRVGVLSIKPGTQAGAHIAPTGKWGLSAEEISQLPGYRQPKTDDYAEAKRLMAKAGYPDGFTVKGAVTVPTHEIFGSYSVFVLKRRLGIEVQLTLLDNARYRETLREGAFEWNFGNGPFAGFDDPDLYFSLWQCGVVENWSNYCNEDFDRLYERQGSTMDISERNELTKQMQRILLDEVPFVDGFWQIFYPGWWNYVKDPPKEEASGIYSWGARYEQVWLDKP